jgi:acetyl esterase
MLHPQAAALAALWAEEPSVVDPGFDIESEREAARAAGLAEPRERVDHVADVDAGGVPARLYRPRVGADALVHLHGGGWVFGDLETHDAHCRRLANRTRRAVLAVDYRRAPEHPYPAASDDVDTAVAWLRHHGKQLGVRSSRPAVLGDSAGGQLALVAALRNPQFFSAAVLVYPCVDPAGAQPSYRTETGGLTAQEMDWFWGKYVPSANDRESPELNPLAADDATLTRMPPTLVLTAEHDPLVDEGERLAEALAAAGAPCVATRYLGMIHGFYGHPEVVDAAGAVLDHIAAFLDGSVSVAAVAAS